MSKIKRILIANRGEIALRIIRACKELGIKTVAVFSDVDEDGVWVQKADNSYAISGDPLEAYLNYKNLINIAMRTRCDAIHPGYGFLSESAEFARACEENDIIFIGPKAEHIALFGDKMASKTAVKKVGVPILEGTVEPVSDAKEGERIASEIGFPVIIKAAFGGGGRGMRIVYKAGEFQEFFESATNEAIKYFGKGEVFIEKYVQNPRHIEVQIVADKYGNVVHLGERDCSIQRRHQKVIEIAPSPRLNDATRKKLCETAVNAVKEIGYENVGTVEFLVDENDDFYFIEMNTRVQVEHPVTEIISGIDIIQRMIEIAGGDKLKYKQEEIVIRGYSIEFRINAENPQNNFMPAVGKITNYMAPGGPGVRLDTSVYAGYTIPPNYDSMVGKLIVYALEWDGVVRKGLRALDEFFIDGVVTNIPLHKAIITEKDFKEGKFNTSYLDEKLPTFDFDEYKSTRSIVDKSFILKGSDDLLY
ncbi:acetyl-CoA carboxylase biotin carboxylase subunit [Sulfurimonas paralvinellae]|uniref:Acetyl-CoA carboxylase biotin carboxylase subunit n=1 Tax=Sulfurimonas paralvinellae TaxID=317658 RepID=A0A7M1B975_9BACT|nr:acetyl-CoA carboxylase biotin carboxylase subunit [Sulfurimonas paralvinellae]QOP45976.1 acetyl-CoA carboxylase biotin carboxylase subunit [Sulfurimonas paralvinellae]